MSNFNLSTLYNFVSTLDRAKKKGVKIVRDIFEEQDEFGKVRYAIVQTYGETTHTFIERNNYKGLFLPGYKPARMKGESFVEQDPGDHINTYSTLSNKSTGWNKCTTQ